MMNRQKNEKTERQKYKTNKKDKRTKRQKDKREFNIVMSGQFRTLAMFSLEGDIAGELSKNLFGR